MKKPIIDCFIKYLERERGPDDDPHVIAGEKFADAINLLRKEDPFRRKTPLMESTFSDAANSTVFYSDKIGIDRLVNGVKLHTGLTSKRQVIREAIIALLIQQKLIAIKADRIVLL
jgi:hypothetical protein